MIGSLATCNQSDGVMGGTLSERTLSEPKNKLNQFILSAAGHELKKASFSKREIKEPFFRLTGSC